MLKVLQIVKRFGPVGGMERYVWELSHSLAKSGIEVHVLCNRTSKKPDHKNIYVHILGTTPSKPRWWSMLHFSRRVTQWVKLNNINNDFVIHSHERTNSHHVTTFHSTLFANVYKKGWWRLLSIRVAVWLYLEKRELCGNLVQAVLPNSDLIHDELKNTYPCIGSRLLKPTYPGTNPANVSSNTTKTNNNKIVIFIGQEWQRKGLKKATKIINKLKETIPEIEFWVLGPNPKEIQHLFTDWQQGYRLLGWKESSPYLPKANLLLHPATAEPYGMAIAEASSFGVPVVISDQCGIASQVTQQSGQVIHNSSSVDEWAKACEEELNRTLPVKNISKSWSELAEQHIQIYKRINLTETISKQN